LSKLRIAFHNVDFSSSSGPNAFCTRLAKELFAQDHVLVNPGDVCDIDFINISTNSVCRGAKKIQRLDGIWTRGVQDNAANAPILHHYKTADHVIWQSEYDRKLISRFWFDRNGSIIRNGCFSPQKIDLNLVAQIRNLADVVFCASASWHAQKRLEANVQAMRKYAHQTNKKCCLLVLGAPDKQISGSDVYYFSHASEDTCFSVYAASDAMLHLAWRDHCPNAVVEALISNTPVICASSGGTKELLVQNSGVVIDDAQDSMIDDLVFDFDKPPQIRIDSFDLPKRNAFSTTTYMIENVAKQYVSVMLGLLNEKTR